MPVMGNLIETTIRLEKRLWSKDFGRRSFGGGYGGRRDAPAVAAVVEKTVNSFRTKLQ